MIIDNCPQDLHFDAAQLVRVNDSRLRLITVSGDPDETVSEIDRVQTTVIIRIDNRAYREIVAILLDKHFKDLDKNEQELLVSFSNGLPVIASLMAGDPDRPKYQPGSLTYDDIVKRLLGDLYTNDQKRLVVMACALFSQLGYFFEMEKQANDVALCPDLYPLDLTGVHQDDHPETRVNRFRAVCQEMIGRGLLETIGRAVAFRPSPLAIRMAQDWWQNCTSTKFLRIIPVLNSSGTLRAFCEQFQYLKHEPRAVEVIGKLCDGVFSLAEVLNTDAGSRLFRSFVNVNPVACAAALTRAFSGKTIPELLKITGGRRNLVWALEKLVFRPDTFDPAVTIMAAFAVAENENIGNNATGQFIQLFHIWLPGTAVDFERRWSIIEYCLAGPEEYRRLGIGAMSSALTVGQFHRMGGAEDQGDPELLKDYAPRSYAAINFYREKCVHALEDIAVNGKEEEQERAISIIIEKFYGLCSDHSGDIIVPVMERLVNRGLVSKVEARRRIQLALGSNRLFDPQIIDLLKQLLVTYEPKDFLEKFGAWVQSPAPDEYRQGRNAGNPGRSLEDKLRDLANVFISDGALLASPPVELVSKHLSEGYRFGKEVGAMLGDISKVKAVISSLLGMLRVVPEAERNFSVVLGTLTGFDSPELDQWTFNGVVNSEILRPFAFLVARERPMPPDSIDLLLTLAERSVIPVTLFSNFEGGFGLKHLDPTTIETFVNRLRSIDETGRTVAFFMLEKWIRRDEQEWEKYKAILTEMVLNDSRVILDVIKSSMDFYEWAEICLKILAETRNDRLADMLMELIIDQSNEMEYFYNKDNSFLRILTVLEESYFPIFWRHLSALLADPGDKGMATYHLKDLLGSRHDYLATTTGLLFRGDQEHFDIILKWAEEQPEEGLHWVANMLPVFNEHPLKADDWHPYAKIFIDKFGDKRSVLSAISAKLGTYSWSGSVVPKLEAELTLYQKLTDHPIPLVREWADVHIKDLTTRIRQEDNRNKDGYLGDFIVSGSRE